jgi:hypothetical protein
MALDNPRRLKPERSGGDRVGFSQRLILISHHCAARENAPRSVGAPPRAILYSAQVATVLENGDVCPDAPFRSFPDTSGIRQQEPLHCARATIHRLPGERVSAKTTLLADTESAEDPIQNIVGVDRTDDLSQVIQPAAQFGRQ